MTTKSVGIELQKDRSLTLVAGGLADPAANEVQVEMKAAPINPADLNVIEGTYPRCPELPGVIGNEGCGTVSKTGSGVTGFSPGQKVISLRSQGSWSTHRNVPAENLIAVPDAIDDRQAAMLSVNPATALRMLTDFQSLEKDDWIIQNAANSGVGRAVIALAREKGLHTVNVVRRAELVTELEELGADVVITEEQLYDRVLRSRSDMGPLKLALNAVGGKSAGAISKALTTGGALVTYGAMGMEPVTLGNGLLIFKNVAAHGFFITGWFERATRNELESMFSYLSDLAVKGSLQVPVAALFPLDRYEDALKAAACSGRDGKILFEMNSD